jgi:AcrR family transcriptional regulator
MSQSATRDRGRIDGRSPGRPRDAAIDEQVLRATLDLLVARGLESTTIQAVSDRTGIARATIYLRWPGRTALLGAMLMRLLTTGKPPTTAFVDDVVTVILAGARTEVER